MTQPGRLVLGALLFVGGCVPLGTFECLDDVECDPDGYCESVGYCSFDDPDCASGRRFSRFAPDGQANRCVEPDPAVEGWWDPAWSRRRRLTFRNGGQDGSLNGFPVLVVLDATRIDDEAVAPDAVDLRFVDDDGQTVLPIEIERWDPEGTSLVWVGVPRIEAASDDDFIDMYYGNPAAMAAESGSPWTEGFVGVWHLGPSLRDATGAGNDGVASGTVAAPGRIGGGRTFSAATDSIDTGAAPLMADVFDGGGSASAWIFANGYGRPTYSRIIDKASDESSTGGYSLLLGDSSETVATLRFARGFSEAHAGWSAPPGAITLGQWHQVAVTYDATVASNAPILYIDGEAVALTMTNVGAGDPQTDIGRPLILGNLGSGDLALDGVLDEVRLARTLRTSDWVRAEFLTGTDAFITYGAEERPE